MNSSWLAGGSAERDGGGVGEEGEEEEEEEGEGWRRGRGKGGRGGREREGERCFAFLGIQEAVALLIYKSGVLFREESGAPESSYSWI